MALNPPKDINATEEPKTETVYSTLLLEER